MAAARRAFAELGKKVVCVGRNFGKHAAEMGEAVPTEPLLFLKPTSSYIFDGSTLRIPKAVTELHHEVELGVVMKHRVQQLSETASREEIMASVDGYVLAYDMTARCLQSKAKKAGLPWSVAKGYDGFCPVSDMVDAAAVSDPQQLQLRCYVDEQLRQDGSTADMIFDVPHLIQYISNIFTLEAGDVILTGTPDGVGPVQAGQVMRVSSRALPVPPRWSLVACHFSAHEAGHNSTPLG
ncbi:uncharacterized protein MONBRDRAFT_16156 [Monosiga brevicollis MX1]|uniref:Fumarylacetoacetase-like C-terminal domain-containing protein n=1 Tax=Monosiga brevicollis TaxID=81824 RepID=A9UW24_MONBE|nr:uncharacterized protein MONBRDRAFT_16156 [Monosiga brevicollis MX1]EDQ90693.1 predicted protein [Monosiga brevicollis MX1]|eukprot:XP_001744744.1 hypothetical protein [Monosiga brevicollis MX1]